MVNQLKDYVRQWRIVWMHFRARSLREIDVPLGTTIIVAPHPDDEVFGCGGLMQQLTRQGHEVYVIFMTGGEGSHRSCCELAEEQIKEARRKMALRINPMLGVDVSHLYFLNYPDGGIIWEHSETDRFKMLLDQLKPSSVFVPHWGEGWPDHVNTRAIVKELVGKYMAVYEYCVWLWYYNVWHLDWHNAYMIRMTKEEHQRKLEAINDYVTPKAPCGKPWSGLLPRAFLCAIKCNLELYYKSK